MKLSKQAKDTNTRQLMIDFWKNCWGVNALRGHIVMLIFGSIFPTIGVFGFHVYPDLGLLAVSFGFVVFAPLLLPSRGISSKKERIQKWILTFATSSVFGLMAGLMLCVPVAKMLGITLTLSILTPSTVWTWVAAVAVCIAYWTCGHMSRDYYLARAGNGAYTPQIWRIHLLLLVPEPGLADEYLEKLRLQDKWALLGSDWEEIDNDTNVSENSLWSKIRTCVLNQASCEKHLAYLGARLQEVFLQIKRLEEEFTTPVDVMSTPNSRKT